MEIINKDPDKMTQEEKIILGIETLKAFFDSVEPDQEPDMYKQIVLEEVVKFLMEKS